MLRAPLTPRRPIQLKWYDGYSVFYVDAEGLVHRMTIQKVSRGCARAKQSCARFR